MAVQRRFRALTLAVVALALTVTGVVVAATDSNPGGQAKDPFVLNGYPPTSAQLRVTASSGTYFNVFADVGLNITQNRVDVVVQIPVGVTSVAIELRLIDNQLYARSAAVSSGPWMALKYKTPALFGFALEMTKPDISFITGYTKKTVTKSGYATTYSFYSDHVAVSSLFAPSTSTAQVGSLLWTITVGHQGEVTQSTMTVSTKSSTTTLSATVVSYNKPVLVAKPAASDIKPISASVISKLLHSKALSSILFPKNFTNLSQVHLS